MNLPDEYIRYGADVSPVAPVPSTEMYDHLNGTDPIVFVELLQGENPRLGVDGVQESAQALAELFLNLHHHYETDTLLAATMGQDVEILTGQQRILAKMTVRFALRAGTPEDDASLIVADNELADPVQEELRKRVRLNITYAPTLQSLYAAFENDNLAVQTV